ncbi:MAG TPA: hypothetical protein P5511_05965, partial [Candidatus Goldiibacteriota bacterium]|nr:hypothetical protein [Candidatus Goldiibacteriota bacterium]
QPKSLDPQQEPKFAEVLPNGQLPLVKAAYPQGNSPRGRELTVATVNGQGPTTMGTGWFYNNASGEIYINSIANDIKGNPYTFY